MIIASKSLPVEDRLLRYQTILQSGKNEGTTTASKLQKELIEIRKDYRELLDSAEARRIVRLATSEGHSNLMWDHVVSAFVSHASRWHVTDHAEARGASADAERKGSLETLDFVFALAHEDGPVLNNAANKLLKLIFEGLKRDDRRLRYGIAFLRLLTRHITAYPVYLARLSGHANKGTINFLNKNSVSSALGFYTTEFMLLLLGCALRKDHPRWAEETAISMGGAGIGGIGSGTAQTLRADALKIAPSQKDFISALIDWIEACPTHADNVESISREVLNPTSSEQPAGSRSVAAGSKTFISLSSILNNMSDWLRSGGRFLDAIAFSYSIVNEWCDTNQGGSFPKVKSLVEGVNGLAPVGSSRAGDKVDPLIILPPSQAVQDVFMESLRMVSSVLLHRGRTAHGALAHSGGSVLAYLIGKVWDSLYVSQRGQHVFRKECARILLLAIRVSVSAYSAQRGDDSNPTVGELVCSGYAARRRSFNESFGFVGKRPDSRSTFLPTSSLTPSPSLLVANSANDGLAGYLTDMGCGVRINLSDDGSFYDLLENGQGASVIRGTSSALPLHLSALNSPPPTCIASSLLGTHYCSHAVYVNTEASGSTIMKPDNDAITVDLLESWAVSSPPTSSSSSSSSTSDSIPRVILSPLASPRLHHSINESDGDVVFPFLLRLVHTLLLPTEVSKGSAQMAGSAPTESYSHIGDSENVPEAYQHSNLAAEALYHAHSVAMAVCLSQRPRKTSTEADLPPDNSGVFSGYPIEFHPGHEKSNVYIWPRLIQSICSVKSATGSGFIGSSSIISSSSAAATVPNLDLLTASLMSHPDILPRGLPTAALIASLAGELSCVLQRQEASLTATLKTLFVLLEIAIGDDTSPSYATTVYAGSAPSEKIRSFCHERKEKGVEPPFSPGSSLAVLSSRSASHLARSKASISTANPTLPFASDVYRKLGDLADASAVHSHLRSALELAIACEARSWSSCAFSLVRTFLPQIASRKDGRLLQQGLRLLSRVLAMGRSRSGDRSGVIFSPSRMTDSNELGQPGAINVQSVVCPNPADLLLVPAWSLPMPCVDITESLLEQCLLLGPFFDPKTHHRSLDATTIVGITTSESLSGAGSTDNSLYAWGTAEYDLLLVLLNSIQTRNSAADKFFRPIFSDLKLSASLKKHGSVFSSNNDNHVVIGALGSSEGYDDVVKGAEKWLQTLFEVNRSATASLYKRPLIPLRDGLTQSFSRLLAGKVDGDVRGNVTLAPRLLLWLLLRVIGDFCAPSSRPRVESAEASLPELCSAISGVLARMQGYNITKTVAATSSTSPAPWLPSPNGTASTALALEYPIARSFPGAKVLNWRISFGSEGSAPSSSLRARLRPYEWGGAPALKLAPGLILPVQLSRLAIIESALYSHTSGIDLPRSVDEAQRVNLFAAAGLHAAPPNSILACHALVISSLNHAASSTIGIQSLLGMFDDMKIADGAITSNSSFSLSSSSLIMAAAVAQSTRCTSALQLQRSIQLLQIVIRCARCMISLPSTVASLRMLTSALLSFIAAHVGNVFDLCIHGTPLPHAPLDGTGTIVRATAIASAFAATLELLLSSGRLGSSTSIGNGCRVGEALVFDESTVSNLLPGSCDPAPLLTHTSIFCVAHIQSTLIRVLSEQGGMTNSALSPSLPNTSVMFEIFRTSMTNASEAFRAFGNDKELVVGNAEKKLKAASPLEDTVMISTDPDTRDELRKDGKRSFREKRRGAFTDDDEEPQKKRSTQDSSLSASLGAVSSMVNDIDDLEADGPSSGGVSLGSSASTVGKKALVGLSRDALSSALIDAVAMAHPLVLSLVSEVSSLSDTTTFASSADGRISQVFKSHLITALPYVMLTDFPTPTLDEFLRRYAQFSGKALAPSAFIAAIASVAVTQAGELRRQACTRSISAILSRLASCEATGGSISNAPLDGGPEQRAWECVAGRLALHSVFLAISMTDDVKSVLQEEPIPAREPSIPVILYSNLPYQPREEDARRLRMFFSPFGSEIHDVDHHGDSVVTNEPSISVASLLFALLVHLNPFSGHGEPGALLADVVTGIGILTKDCPESAFELALSAVSAFYEQSFNDIRASETSRSRSEMLDYATTLRLHRKVYPCTPVDSFRDWAFHVIMRMAINASLFPQARAAASRVLAPFALLFGDMNLFNRSYATSTCSPVLASIGNDSPTLAFPGLSLPSIHLSELQASTGHGINGWSDRESDLHDSESDGHQTNLPVRMSLLSTDTPALTDGSCSDRLISSMWALSYLVARCAPESNAALLQLVLRSYPAHPFAVLARRALAHAASISGFSSIHYGAHLQVTDGGAAISRLLHSRIDFLVSQWILRCLPWSSFPYGLLGYTTLKDFLVNHRLRITAMCIINASLRRIGWCQYHLSDNVVNSAEFAASHSEVEATSSSDVARNAIKRLELISIHCAQEFPDSWPASLHVGPLSKLEYDMFDCGRYSSTGENEAGAPISRLADIAYSSASRGNSNGWKWLTLGSAKGSIAAGAAGGDVSAGFGGPCDEIIRFTKAFIGDESHNSLDPYVSLGNVQPAILTKTQISLCAELVSESMPWILAYISPLPSFVDVAAERDADDARNEEESIKKKNRRPIAPLMCAAVFLTAAEILASGKTSDVNNAPLTPEACVSSITSCCSKSVSAAALGSLLVYLQAPVFNLEGTILQQVSSREFSKSAAKASVSFLAYFFEKSQTVGSASEAPHISSFFAAARPQSVIMILRFGAADILRRISLLSSIQLWDERSDQLKRIDRNTQQWALVLKRLVPLFVTAALPSPVISGKSGASLSASSKFHFSSGGGVTSLFRFFSSIIASSATALRVHSSSTPDKDDNCTKLISKLIAPARSLKIALLKALSDRIFELITTSTAGIGSVFISCCRSMRLIVACELQLIISSALRNDVEFFESRLVDLAFTLETLASWVYGISLAEEKKADTSDFLVPLIRNTIGSCLCMCISDVIALIHSLETVSTFRDRIELSPNLLSEASFTLLQLPDGCQFSDDVQQRINAIVSKCRELMSKKVILDALQLTGYEISSRRSRHVSHDTSEAIEGVCASLQGFPFRLAFATVESFSHPAALPAMSSLMRLAHELAFSINPLDKVIVPDYPHKISSLSMRQAPTVLCLHLLESIANTVEFSPLKKLATLCVHGLEKSQGRSIRDMNDDRRALAVLFGEYTHVHAHTHGPLLDLSPEVLIKKSSSNSLSEYPVNVSMYAHGPSRSDHIASLGSNAGSYDASQPLCRILCTPACLFSSSAAFTLLSTAATVSRSEKIALEAADPTNPVIENLLSSRGETQAKVAKSSGHRGLGCVPDIPLYSSESYCHVRSLGLLAEAISIHECSLGESGSINDDHFTAQIQHFPQSFATDYAALVSLEASFPIPFMSSRLSYTAQNMIRSESGSEAFEMLPSRYRETLSPWIPDAAMAIQSKVLRSLSNLPQSGDTYLYNDRTLSIEGNGLPSHQESISMSSLMKPARYVYMDALSHWLWPNSGEEVTPLQVPCLALTLGCISLAPLRFLVTGVLGFGQSLTSSCVGRVFTDKLFPLVVASALLEASDKRFGVTQSPKEGLSENENRALEDGYFIKGESGFGGETGASSLFWDAIVALHNDQQSPPGVADAFPSGQKSARAFSARNEHPVNTTTVGAAQQSKSTRLTGGAAASIAPIVIGSEESATSPLNRSVPANGESFIADSYVISDVIVPGLRAALSDRIQQSALLSPISLEATLSVLSFLRNIRWACLRIQIDVKDLQKVLKAPWPGHARTFSEAVAEGKLVEDAQLGNRSQLSLQESKRLSSSGDVFHIKVDGSSVFATTSVPDETYSLRQIIHGLILRFPNFDGEISGSTKRRRTLPLSALNGPRVSLQLGLDVDYSKLVVASEQRWKNTSSTFSSRTALASLGSHALVLAESALTALHGVPSLHVVPPAWFGLVSMSDTFSSRLAVQGRFDPYDLLLSVAVSPSPMASLDPDGPSGIVGLSGLRMSSPTSRSQRKGVRVDVFERLASHNKDWATVLGLHEWGDLDESYSPPLPFDQALIKNNLNSLILDSIKPPVSSLKQKNGEMAVQYPLNTFQALSVVSTGFSSPVVVSPLSCLSSLLTLYLLNAASNAIGDLSEEGEVPIMSSEAGLISSIICSDDFLPTKELDSLVDLTDDFAFASMTTNQLPFESEPFESEISAACISSLSVATSARLTRIRLQRVSGRLPQAVKDLAGLQELRKLILGEAATDFVSKPISPTAGSKRSHAGSRPVVTESTSLSIDECYTRASVIADDGLLFAEQAHLAWAMGDAQTALVLIRNASIQLVAALRLILSFSSENDIDIPWVRISLFCCIGRLSSFLVAAARWLTTSGLDHEDIDRIRGLNESCKQGAGKNALDKLAVFIDALTLHVLNGGTESSFVFLQAALDLTSAASELSKSSGSTAQGATQIDFQRHGSAMQSRAHLAIARYCDSAFTAIFSQSSRNEGISAKKRKLEELVTKTSKHTALIKAKKANEAAEVLGGVDLHAMRRYIAEIKQGLDEDVKLEESSISAMRSYQKACVKHYCRYLRLRSPVADSLRHNGADELKTVFRLVAMWTNLGSDPSTNAEHIESLCNLFGNEFADKTPPSSLLLALPQLVAHLGPEPGPISKIQTSYSFAGALEHAVTRMLIAAPHRTSIQLLALEKGERVLQVTRVGDGIRRKITAAMRVLSKGSSESPRLRKVISSMRLLSDVYVSIAMRPIHKVNDADRGKETKLSSVLISRSIGQVMQPVVTSTSDAQQQVSSSSHSPTFASTDPFDKAYEGHPVSVLEHVIARKPFKSSSIKEPASSIKSPQAVNLDSNNDYWPSPMSDMPIITAGYIFSPSSIVSTAPLESSDPYLLPEHVTSFGLVYSHPLSGISFPKKLKVTSSCGRVYSQLIKGGWHEPKSSVDDMRQDAIIEGLFTVLNSLLAQDSSASARKLRMSTYRVIPLSPTCGVLEWIENIIPIGHWIDEDPWNAHRRYRPNEWDRKLCRDTIYESHNKWKQQIAAQPSSSASGASSKQSLRSSLAVDPRPEALRTVFKHRSPVFQNFFSEMFPSPEALVAARLAYTRSTAVASVVGYIAGISDRHYNNIMVHCSPGENACAGEVLHIDFGIVFEQGLLLPTPETVPFRLTRDIVAGFGVANTRGAFSSSMEKCLQVLRSNADTIMGVFTVLLHDPLCKWVLTDDKARKVLRTRSVRGADDDHENEAGEEFVGVSSGQDHKAAFDGSSEKHDVAAMHVLKRIDSKLRGTDFVSISSSSSSSILPIHAQVIRLLDMAQDMDALSRLFSGWHAWC